MVVVILSYGPEVSQRRHLSEGIQPAFLPDALALSGEVLPEHQVLELQAQNAIQLGKPTLRATFDAPPVGLDVFQVEAAVVVTETETAVFAFALVSITKATSVDLVTRSRLQRRITKSTISFPPALQGDEALVRFTHLRERLIRDEKETPAQRGATG